MPVANRIHYYRRVFRAYLTPSKSQLTFWHEDPQANPRAQFDRLGEYYMTFAAKADYPGHYDTNGIPMLDYHGRIGLQYNPIAIAQYGLGNYNRLSEGADRRVKCLAAANWLVENLELNAQGVAVWMHKFDWDYRDTLRAPWYSGLAQGQGISLLVRAHAETQDSRYADAAQRAFVSFSRSIEEGGVMYVDQRGDPWIEEYIVNPPTHILNGFLWAAWGVYDYWLATRESAASDLMQRVTETLLRNLENYDIGFWSLYEQSGTFLRMVASPFYHRLHIVQLRIMAKLTGERRFAEMADRWELYERSGAKRIAALGYKSVFKLCYY